MKSRELMQHLVCKNPAKKIISRMTQGKKWQLYEQKSQFQFFTKKEIEAIQLEKLKKLLENAQRAPYYKKILSNLRKPIDQIKMTDLQSIPLLTKKIVMDQLPEMLCKDKTFLFPKSTGGSTGTPMKFYMDNNYRENAWANSMLINEFSGCYYGARVARLWGVPMKNGIIPGKIKNILQNTRFYNTLNLSEDNLAHFHKEMSQFQPEYIITYTSAIYLLARYLHANGIKPTYPSLAINTSCETLYPHMRRTIENVFGVKCFDRYGSSEINGIACECKAHSGMHVFADNVIVECLDPVTGEPVFDKPGDLVVTDLSNHGMPFIRYKMADVATLSRQKCSCGRNTPVMPLMVGRDSDYLALKNGKVYDYDYITNLFYKIDGIKEFQFVQEKLDKFTVYIEKMNDCSDKIKDQVRVNLGRLIGADSDLDIQIVQNIFKTPSGKNKYFISKVNPEILWATQAAGQKQREQN